MIQKTDEQVRIAAFPDPFQFMAHVLPKLTHIGIVGTESVQTPFVGLLPACYPISHIHGPIGPESHVRGPKLP